MICKSYGVACPENVRFCPQCSASICPDCIEPVPAPDSQESEMRFPLPHFLRVFHMKKTLSNALFCLLFYGAFFLIMFYLASVNSAAEFSSYKRLERLFDRGTRFVVAEAQSIRSVELGTRTSGTDLYSSSKESAIHYLIEMPDGVVFIVGDDSLVRQPRESRMVFSIRKSNEDYYQGLINNRLRLLSALPYNRYSSSKEKELAFLNRISENVKPLRLRPVNVGLATTLAYVFGAVAVVMFAIFYVRLLRSGIILAFPWISRTYRILAKYGDPEQLVMECQASVEQSRKKLESREHLLVDGFVIYPSSTSVFIAPVNELVRAHVTRVHYDRDLPGPEVYEMELYFSKTGRISYSISDRTEGMSELKWIKAQNPNTYIGSNPEFHKYQSTYQ